MVRLFRLLSHFEAVLNQARQYLTDVQYEVEKSKQAALNNYNVNFFYYCSY